MGIVEERYQRPVLDSMVHAEQVETELSRAIAHPERFTPPLTPEEIQTLKDEVEGVIFVREQMQRILFTIREASRKVREVVQAGGWQNELKADNGIHVFLCRKALDLSELLSKAEKRQERAALLLEMIDERMLPAENDLDDESIKRHMARYIADRADELLRKQ